MTERVASAVKGKQDWESIYEFTDTSTKTEQLNLSGIDFGGWDLTGADFSGMVLIGASFDGAILENADFQSADLDSASFRHANLTGANLVGCTARGTDFTRAKLTNVLAMQSSFVAATLHKADLTGAAMIGTLGIKADLSHATLDGSDFSKSDWRGADVRGAKRARLKSDDARLPESTFRIELLVSAIAVVMLTAAGGAVAAYLIGELKSSLLFLTGLASGTFAGLAGGVLRSAASDVAHWANPRKC